MKCARTALLVGLAALVVASARAEDGDAVKKDLAQLQGEWLMVSGSADGQAMPDELLSTAKRACKGDETSVAVGGQIILKAKFNIDPTKKPRTIDYQSIDGPTKGSTLLGIYELDGDNVKFCFGAPGKERPTDFTSKQGDRRTLSVWKRDVKAITPAEAAKKVDEEVTLQMAVKSSALLDGGVCFLNSEEDHKSDKNFTIFLGKDALAKFKEAKIDDPAAHFKGKVVQVKGKVTLYRDKPQIAIDGPDAVKLVEKKVESGK